MNRSYPKRNIYDINPEEVFNTFQPEYDEHPVNKKQERRTISRKKHNLSNLPDQNTINELEQSINHLFTTSECPTHNPPHITNKVDKSYGDDDYKEPTIDTKILKVQNVKETPLEYIDEHTIVIDSVDRNIEKYPNPFDYRVYFNSQYDDANIQHVFENVKSISLEVGVLPEKYYYTKTNVSVSEDDDLTIRNLTSSLRNTEIDLTSVDVSGTFVVVDVNDVLSGSRFTRKVKFARKTPYPDMVIDTYEYSFTFDAIDSELPPDVHDSNTTYPINIQKFTLQDFNLLKNKYNVLNTDEFTFVNPYSTNDVIAKSFALLFIDTKCNGAYYAKTKMNGKIFLDDSLGTLSRLTIHLCDYTGKQLSNSFENNIDLEVPRNKLCTCYTDEEGVFVRDYRCSCSYIRHPLYHPFQNTLIFKVKTWNRMIDQEIF